MDSGWVSEPKSSAHKDRLSQRRGLGLLTIDHHQDQLPGEPVEDEEQLLVDGRDGRRDGVRSSSRKDGVVAVVSREEGTVTVRELRRDQPFDSASPSPSSKFRTALPGCSPRWPTQHGGSIFSFPSSFSSSASSVSAASPSYPRRRLLYPFFGRSRWFPAASYHLPAVAEQPVGDASARLVDHCAVLVDKDFCHHPYRPGSAGSRTTTPFRVPAGELSWPTAAPALTRQWTATTTTTALSQGPSGQREAPDCRQYHGAGPPSQHPGQCCFCACHCAPADDGHEHQLDIVEADDHFGSTPQAEDGQSQIGKPQDCRHHRHHHHQWRCWLAGGGLGHRAGLKDQHASCCSHCFAADKEASVSSSIHRCGLGTVLSGAAQSVAVAPGVEEEHRRGILVLPTEREDIGDDSVHSGGGSEHDVVNGSCRCRGSPLDFAGIMDGRHSLPRATPLSASAASAGTQDGRGATTASKSIDGSGVRPPSAASQSSSSSSWTVGGGIVAGASSAPLPIHPSCHHHEVVNKMGNCGTSLSCRTSAPSVISSWFHQGNATSSEGVVVSSQPIGLVPTSGGNIHQHGLPPDRPFRRSRSPKETSPSRSVPSSTTVDGRDRRAFSADRPIPSEPVVPAIPSGSAAISAASRAKTRSVGPTKVERLRQLTQRLRPTSSPSCSRDDVLRGLPPSGLPPPPLADSAAINCQLPPIPVAPPRHPDRKARCEKKKSTSLFARDKRDSATSTSDLAEAHPAAAAVVPFPTSPASPQSAGASASGSAIALVAKSIADGEVGGDLPGLWPESDAKNSDIVRKKTAAGSSAEVTRPSLFWSPAVHSAAAITPPPPTNGSGPSGHQREGSIFDHNQLDSGSIPSAPGNAGEDLFDDAQHLTLSKLNPRILVGTYTQRTIPFRSASFSQIDVGTDGTYNRRPRTSITLKPVTYSIGRTESSSGSSTTPYSPQPTASTSLPRSLPSSNTSNAQLPTQLVHESLPSSSSCPAASSSEAKLLWKGQSSSSEEFDPERELANAAEPGVLETSLNPREMEAGPVKPDPTVLDPSAKSDDDTTPPVSAAENQRREEEDNKTITDYETTEISVSAEIRLSPVTTLSESDAFANSAGSTEASSNMKALPVLDLLELSNHLLRLKAATRESSNTLGDHLADLEVAAQFSPDALLPDSDGGLIKQDSSESAERPSWLSDMLRLTNGESTSSLSDEGCVVDSNEFSTPRQTELSGLPALSSSAASVMGEEVYGTPPEQPLELLASAEKILPSSKPQLGRTSSGKRRRRSSSLAVSSLTVSVADSGLCTKSNSARSLTFLPTKSETQAAATTMTTTTTTTDSADNNNQRVMSSKSGLAVSHLAKDDSISSDTFVDAFQPAASSVGETEKNNVPAAAVLDERASSPSSSSSLPPTALAPNPADSLTAAPNTGMLLVIGSSQRTSAGSDDQEDDESTNAKVDDPEESARTTAKPTSHRLTVSVNLTLAPDPDPASRNTSPSPFSPDLMIDGSNSSGCFSPSADKTPQNKSPLTPRRYGLKRRPLRGPYGEMLEAEMNKSEFGKMYSRRTAEDLSFLREPTCPRNREAKSSSPRPISPQASTTTESAISSGNVSYNVRQNSLPLPTFHSLDDSQLKVGYNSTTLPSLLPSSASASPSRLVLPKRKISANIPYVFSDGDLEASGNSSVSGNRSNNLSPLLAPTPQQESNSKPSSVHVRQLSVSGGTGVSSNHQRTSSSPCQLMQFTTEAGFTSEDEPELLELTSLSGLSRSTARLLESTQQDSVGTVPGDRHTLPLTRVGSAKRQRDTRTHAVGELYDTERSYVESLQILVTKYLQPLKNSPEYAGLVEGTLVDEIFYQIPAILAHHEVFLEELRKRLESWDSKQCVGGVFLEALTKPSVIETYTAYINHWKHAKEAVKLACSAKSAFSKFLEAMAREHKGKLALDSLLIMPVQRIPRYELLIKVSLVLYGQRWGKCQDEGLKVARIAIDLLLLEADKRNALRRRPEYLDLTMLLKHTARDHPDHALLLEAQREVHELAVKINCVEREAYGVEQQQATLRELESLVEGLGPGNLATPERTFIRHDCVTIPSSLGGRKERGLFLFSDLLVITSVKRRGAAIRKSSSYSSSGIASTLEANKFKLLMRVPLDDLEMTKGKDDSSRRSTKDLEHLEEDLAVLNQMSELVSSLHVSHPTLDEAIKDVQHNLQRQLSEKQSSLETPQLATIDLAISTQDGTETLSVAFTSSEKRASWEESFIETKLKLRAMSPDRRPPPEFLTPLPIRKTRAGLQFTCAAPTVVWNSQHFRDVWVCNSDGYVGQVCILSLHPEPNVASCNGVCNARITCIAAVPAAHSARSQDPSNLTDCKVLNDSKMESSPDRSTANTRELAKSSNARSNFELESSESSSESSEGEESGDDEPTCPVNFNRIRSDSIPVDVPPVEEGDVTSNQATMWLGTEDGCIHIYHCGENIRLKKNRIRIQQGAAVLSILYVENRVFASLANGDIVVYDREQNGAWNINDPQCVTIGSIIAPVTRMLYVNNGLWCASQNTVKILDIHSLSIQDQFAVSSDSQRSVLSMSSSNGLGVWVAMQGSAVVRLFHGLTHECICDVNLAPAVNKMLSGCDDIIRQHKAACLRVTSMLVCHDLVWVGTSAGVILTIPTPLLTPTSSRLSTPPVVTGIPHGHTGHVRFLTCVEATPEASRSSRSHHHHHPTHHRFSLKGKETLASVLTSASAATASSSPHGVGRLFVISGGDGYEDFRHTGFSDSVGREDSTNHLLLWQV